MMSTTPVAARSKLEVLTVNADEKDCAALREILRHTNWIFHCVPDIPQALRFLDSHFVPVIVCARQLRSGNWKELVAAVTRYPVPPMVLVYTAESNDAFWMEVLHTGGYDVLLTPFNRAVALRLISLASRKWRDDARALKPQGKSGSTQVPARAAGRTVAASALAGK